MTSGDCDEQTAIILDYNGSTKVATINKTWSDSKTPGSEDGYSIQTFSNLGEIQVAHSGTGADNKGVMKFNVNDGGDNPDNSAKCGNTGKSFYIKPNDEHNLLRPETVESSFILWRLTKNPKYRIWGWKIFKAFQKYCKISTGGYSSIKSVVECPLYLKIKWNRFGLQKRSNTFSSCSVTIQDFLI